MEEVWMDIEGFEGFYQVSNMGQVKSIPRIIKRDYRGNAKRNGKLLKQSKTRKGYLRITMQCNGVKKQVSVHTIVAKAFIPNTNNYPQVNHKNGDKTKNNALNLEWCTNSMNTQHAYDTGLIISNRGVNCHNSRFTESDILNIRDLHFNKQMKGAEIARIYGVVKSTIYFILKGETWNHVIV